MPLASTTRAPAGTVTLPSAPTAVIRLPLMTMTLFLERQPAKAVDQPPADDRDRPRGGPGSRRWCRRLASRVASRLVVHAARSRGRRNRREGAGWMHVGSSVCRAALIWRDRLHVKGFRRRRRQRLRRQQLTMALERSRRSRPAPAHRGPRRRRSAPSNRVLRLCGALVLGPKLRRDVGRVDAIRGLDGKLEPERRVTAEVGHCFDGRAVGEPTVHSCQQREVCAFGQVRLPGSPVDPEAVRQRPRSSARDRARERRA